MYLSGEDPKHPLASPLYADLDGLPPLMIHVGTAEVLLDDSRRLADRAKAVGVDVTLHVYEDLFHVWHYYAQMLPEADEAIAELGAFFRDCLADV
jgi:acetyl esterase/lipase